MNEKNQQEPPQKERDATRRRAGGLEKKVWESEKQRVGRVPAPGRPQTQPPKPGEPVLP